MKRILRSDWLTKRVRDFSRWSPRKCCLFGHIITPLLIKPSFFDQIMVVYWPRLGQLKRRGELGQYPAILTFCLVNNGSGNSKRAHTPLPPGNCYYYFVIITFLLEKLQMPHGGAGRFITKAPRWSIKKWANAPPRGNTKIVFSIK